ncbi:MAG: protein-L-isoaspartate(D-aspartate) O-methyltransferase [Salinivirgaceae bacterium]
MEDTFRHKGLRNRLVQEISAKGITSEKVLKAIGAVPRHFFFDSVFTDQAYADKPFPIGAEQTISQPFTVAFQTQLLDVQPGDKVLEIGTGSGYQAAILAALRTRVFTIERQRELFRKSQQTIALMGYKNINFFYGDGFEGKASYAPFNKIIITCGAPYVPEQLIEQLSIGGVMVVPLDDKKNQVMNRITRLENGKLKYEKFGNFSFVPMLKGTQ